MAKKRIDVLLVERGLSDSRAAAQRLVDAGQVRVNGKVALKPSQTVAEECTLAVDQGPPYVSRGGEKLAGALAIFPIRVQGLVCADVGASTGGFTDCLLQNGAAKVYAIDVGKGILHWKLRQDPRVVVMEETNARYVEALPEPISLATIDASFISLKILLPVVKGWFGAPAGEPANAGQVLALIKPQFEAGRKEVAHGDGVIRDEKVHRQVLSDVFSFAQREGFAVAGLIRSPLLGPKGNTEFLAWLVSNPSPTQEINDLNEQIEQVFPSNLDVSTETSSP
jgi:23S rRNA (cytidine1920-2'-O)/16S rRNA (cytidine1409-2'-O)-methyltransferase